MNVRLPDELEKKTLETLLPGETVYTLPWAMFADKDGELWLNGNYPYSQEPYGTMSMRVSRVRGGYHVDLSHVDSGSRTWSRVGAGYVGNPNPLPVVELTWIKG